MNQTKHTPGPLLINPYKDSQGNISIYENCGGIVVASVHPVPANFLDEENSAEAQEANAKLYALSPEMLETLKEVQVDLNSGMVETARQRIAQLLEKLPS